MALDIFIDFAAGGSPVGGPGGAIGPVQGEATDPTYNNTIAVSSFSLGIQNPTSIGAASSGAGAGKAQFQALKFTKNVDKASLGLFTALATGAHFKTVKLYVRGAGGKTAFLIYELELAFITQIQTSNGDSAVQEEVQVAFGALQLSYSQMQAGGQLSSAVTAAWNQVTNSSSLNIPGN